MVPTGDIRDRNGRLILPAGRVLTAGDVKTLKAWGIDSIEVASEAVEPASEATGDQAVDVKGLFQYADCDHPAMKELLDLAVQRRKCIADESKNEGGVRER
jgi:hypothetical protein